MGSRRDHVLRVISPVDGSIVVERPLALDHEVDEALDRARRVGRAWRQTPLEDRLDLLSAMVDVFVERGGAIAEEITLQMGRPLRDAPGEVRGFEERARTMLRLGAQALPDIVLPDKPGFTRFIRREPLGTVLVLAPWNYPYLTAVNTVVPALLAGNAVVLKHSNQTPLCAERMVEAGLDAGLPEGLFQFLHMTHEQTARVVADPRVDFVCFTGSVEGGRAVHNALAGTFKAVNLELGGKDPAYVRADADLDQAVAGTVEGAFYNAGQSCCAIERVYVHKDRYEEFVEAYVARVRRYVLGDPFDLRTTLGPVVRASHAAAIRAQVEAALAAGARGLIDPADYPQARPDSAFVAPQVLVDVTDPMQVMTEETFGPVVGIAPVASDEEAVARMNDSQYGLTASIWTMDLDAARALGDQIETGTVYANRCDYLDPELAWVGVKNSGRGCSLSRLGYEALTRPKSFHLRQGSPP